jgi:pyruvate dehydrogenase E1 component alpha subunit
MLLIRRFEEKAGQLYGMGHIGGFCHLYIGQEAVVVGMEMAMKEGDQVITSYRDHGHMLATGMDPKGVMAELTGRQGGYSKGKGGSMHMFSREKQFYGGHGIVGAQVPLGAGLAFANKYREQRSTSRPPISAKAPPTRARSTRRSTWRAVEAAGDLRHREQRLCHGHGGEAVCGAGRGVVQPRLGLRHSGRAGGRHGRARGEGRGDKATEHCRSGKGPIILEMKTYRYRGHSMSDPAKYRTREEVQKMREEHDPIEQVKRRLSSDHGVSDDDIKAVDARIRKVVTEAADFAQNDPLPDVSELWSDVYVDA